jgi:hypothetical protein
VTAAKLLAFAELVLDSKSYATLDADGPEVLSTIVEIIVDRRWIEDLTVAIEKLTAASVSFRYQVRLTDSCQRRNTLIYNLSLDY